MSASCVSILPACPAVWPILWFNRLNARLCFFKLSPILVRERINLAAARLDPSAIFFSFFITPASCDLGVRSLRRTCKAVLAVLFSNTFINAAILRIMGRTVRESIYVGALLAQIGELSFLLAAASFRYHIISDFAYHATIATIAISLLLNPAWIYGVRKVLDRYFVNSDSFKEVEGPLTGKSIINWPGFCSRLKGSYVCCF